MHGHGLQNHRRHIQPLAAPLDVVAVISNPVRYRSRYDLYRQFERMVLDAGARLTTVELAYGDRPFEIVGHDPRTAYHGLRTKHELWHKENLINLGISRLPHDWSRVAWIDADVQFSRSDWVQETLQQLEHYAVVQMWSHAQDLGPNHEPLQLHTSFAWDYLEGRCGGLPDPYAPKPKDPVNHWHPGYAWAATREALEGLGQLIQFAILGAGDNHMARALVGRVEEGLHPQIGRVYRERLLRWQHRADRHIRRNLGAVPGTLLHYHHGPKVARGYWSRWKILVSTNFNPDTDIERDWQGVLHLTNDHTDRGRRLRDGIRRYFRSRNEDSEAV